MLKYRNVGQYGLKVSEIALGTMSFEEISEEISHNILKNALDHDIIFIDTADIYGTEEKVGSFIQDYDRSDFVLSSKVWWPISNNPNNRGLSKKHINESIDKSLKKLQTGYLDIYFCHRFDYNTPLEETIFAMNDLIEEGKILYWGTSIWSAAEIERAYGIAKSNGVRPPIVDQPRYHLFNRDIEVELLHTIDYTGIGITAYSPLAKGLLTGKYTNVDVTTVTNDFIEPFDRNLPYGLYDETIFSKIDKLTELAKTLDLTLPQLALAWALTNARVSTLIIGASKPERIDQNAVASEVTLDETTLTQIEEIIDYNHQYPTIYPFNYRAYLRAKSGKEKSIVDPPRAVVLE